MDNAEHVDVHQAGAAPSRRKLNWSAIWAGIVSTLGFFTILLYLGSSLGLTFFDPFKGVFHETALSWAVLCWVAFSVIVSSFFGAWISGHWANLHEAQDAIIHGTATWALSLLFATLGIAVLSQMTNVWTPGHVLATERKALTFNSLDDPQFTAALASQANRFAASQPIPVTAEKKTPEPKQEPAQEEKKEPAATAPSSVGNRAALERYVSANTNLDPAQAQEFVNKHKEQILKDEQQSYRRWEQANSKNLAEAEGNHRKAIARAWSVFGFAALALLFAIGGAYAGWTRRYNTMIEEEKMGGLNE